LQEDPFVNWLKGTLRSAITRILIWLLRLHTKPYGTLRISCSSIEGDSPDFFPQVVNALELIRVHSPRQRERIEHLLDFIVDNHLISSGGKYVHAYRGCVVNYRCYLQHCAGPYDMTERSQRALTLELAQVIIHEATHARVENAGVPYSPQYRERIERLCRNQEVRFLNQAARDITDVFGNTIDWNEYHDFEQARPSYTAYWNKSKSEHARELLRAVYEEFRSTDHEPLIPFSWSERHRELWELSLPSSPLTTEAMLARRAGFRLAMKDFDGAIHDYRVLVREQPTSLLWNEKLAESLYLSGQFMESYEAWDRSRPLESAVANHWMFHALVKMHRFEEAVRHWDENRSSIDDTCTCRAAAFLGCHRYDETLIFLESLISDAQSQGVDPALDVLCAYGWLLRHVGRTEQFGEVWEAIESRRNWWRACCDPDAHLHLAYVLSVDDAMRAEGLVSDGAVLLVCPAERDSAELLEHLSRVGRRIRACPRDAASGNADAYLRSLLWHNSDYPWRDVPRELVDGREVFAVDMPLPRILLPGGRVQGEYLPVWIRSNDGNCDEPYEAMLASSLGDELSSFFSEQFSASQ
jgi:hypothetical protein